MGKVILIGLYLTASCFQAAQEQYRVCVEESKKSGLVHAGCKVPSLVQGVGLYLGVPKISVGDVDKSCFEVKAKVVGEEAEGTYSIDEWNKKATPRFVPLTSIRNTVENSEIADIPVAKEETNEEKK